jgi:hypothetical protein
MTHGDAPQPAAEDAFARASLLGGRLGRALNVCFSATLSVASGSITPSSGRFREGAAQSLFGHNRKLRSVPRLVRRGWGVTAGRLERESVRKLVRH